MLYLMFIVFEFQKFKWQKNHQQLKKQLHLQGPIL